MTGGRVEPRFVAEVKSRTRLVELIAPAVEKWKQSAEGGRGLCPFHHERSPSFYVVEAKGFWHCFGCGAHGDAVGWIMQTTTAGDFREAVDYLAERCGLMAREAGRMPAVPKAIVKRTGAAAIAEERARKINLARGIWAATLPLDPGSVAARYLRDNRNIAVTPPPTLRFHPQLRHPHADRKDGGTQPALVGAVQGPDDEDGGRHIVGVHCTFLLDIPPPGVPGKIQRWQPKIMRGACWSGSVRLTPAEDTMIVAEGIETALSVLQGMWDAELGAAHIDGEPVGVWAALSLGNLAAIWLPGEVREIIIAADNDMKPPLVFAGGKKQVNPEEIIEKAAERHREQGRLVRIARPPAGCDFNDLLTAGVPLTEVVDI